MRKKSLCVLSMLAMLAGFSAAAFAGDELKLSDIISGNGSVSGTSGGKTTTYSGDPKVAIVQKETKAAPKASDQPKPSTATGDIKITDILKGNGSVSVTEGGKTKTYSGHPLIGLAEKVTTTDKPKADDKPKTSDKAKTTATGDVKLSDIISGNGSASATGGGKTTTYSGDPQKGLKTTTTDRTMEGPDQTGLEPPPAELNSPDGVTWSEYLDGLEKLNKDVEDKKITEEEWNKKTQALRAAFLAGERQRGANKAPPAASDDGFSGGFGGGEFGDGFGPSAGAPPLITPGPIGPGTEIFIAPGGPGGFPTGEFDDNLLHDPAFQVQRFNELFGGQYADPNEQPN